MPGRSLNYRRGRSGRPLQAIKAHVYATQTHCCLCGNEVDLTLPYRDPATGRVNKLSKSIEHPIELDRGGDPYAGVMLAHLGCNASKGASYGNAKRAELDEYALSTGLDDSLD